MRSFIRVTSVILLVVWMGFIFYLSAQPAEASSEISGGVIEVIAEKFYPHFESLSEVQKAEVIASFQFEVRKSAHVCGFAVLGFFAFISFITYTKIKMFLRLLLSVVLSLAYAVGDEFHQRFVPGRSCELRDVLLDTAGILIAVLLTLAFVEVIGPLRRRVAYKGRKAKKISNVVKQETKIINIPNLEEEIIENCLIEQDVTENIEEDTVAHNLQEAEQILPIEDDSEEEKVQEKSEIKLSQEMEYAASVIGEAVIEATKVCNKLAANGDENTKELVNLVLGRNEVLKSEILQILSLETAFEQKQNLIQSEKIKAYDYFNSILAQMC